MSLTLEWSLDIVIAVILICVVIDDMPRLKTRWLSVFFLLLLSITIIHRINNLSELAGYDLVPQWLERLLALFVLFTLAWGKLQVYRRARLFRSTELRYHQLDKVEAARLADERGAAINWDDMRPMPPVESRHHARMSQ